jgi:hypothetical protein
MGYTHYCLKPKEISQEKWNSFVTDFKTILPYFEVLLDKTTDQKLIINENEILFNGIDEASHETFYIERVESNWDETESVAFSFCKTARKPYDIAVCCALIIGAKYMPIQVESDGDEEWIDAKKLCQEKLGYGLQFHFNHEGKLVETTT